MPYVTPEELLLLLGGGGAGVGPPPVEPPPVPAPSTQRDMMSWGLSALTRRLNTHLSQPITYVRGDVWVECTATFGKKLLKLADDFGNMRIEWTDMDFLIPAADLILEGAAARPRRGDRVLINIGGNVETFEVAAFGDEPPWRYSDPYHRMIRVHTKHINTEAYVP